jgi:hypothetical protein
MAQLWLHRRGELLKKHDPQEGAELSAQLASLNYVSDEMPGISRKRAGRGFRYVWRTSLPKPVAGSARRLPGWTKPKRSP